MSRCAGWGSCALVCASLCAGLPGRARADAAAEVAGAAPTRPTREQIQRLHDACQRHIDEERAVEAGQCLEEVYAGLVAMDPMATVDLYYVLSDAVAALQAAATVDPRDLCRAEVLLQDYRGRRRSFAARRQDAKVTNLIKQNAGLLEEARRVAQRDVCVAEPVSAAAGEGEVGEEAGEAGAPTGEASAPTSAGEATPTTTAPVQRAAPRPAAMKRASPRRELFQPRLPYTALLDASFGVTLAGVAGAGVGTAMYIYGLECREGPPRCSSVAPQGVRDAGLVFMGAGAVTMIVGFGLRFADHRAARKALRALPRATGGLSGGGVVWSGRF